MQSLGHSCSTLGSHDVFSVGVPAAVLRVAPLTRFSPQSPAGVPAVRAPRLASTVIVRRVVASVTIAALAAPFVVAPSSRPGPWPNWLVNRTCAGKVRCHRYSCVGASRLPPALCSTNSPADQHRIVAHFWLRPKSTHPRRGNCEKPDGGVRKRCRTLTRPGLRSPRRRGALVTTLRRR